MSDVTKEGDRVFSFKLGKHKHSFEAKTQDERNGWLAAIESTHESAIKAKDEILSRQGYKDEFNKLNTGTSQPPIDQTVYAYKSQANLAPLLRLPPLREHPEPRPLLALVQQPQRSRARTRKRTSLSRRLRKSDVNLTALTRRKSPRRAGLALTSVPASSAASLAKRRRRKRKLRRRRPRKTLRKT